MNPILTHPLLLRLGLTLVHSLWELVVLALLARAGLDLLQRRSSAAQHAWAFACHCAMGLTVLATFLVVQPPAPASGIPLLVAPDITVEVTGPAASGLTARLLASPVLPWASVVWLVATAFMLLRLAGGVAWIHKVRHRSHAAPEALKAMADRVARAMGLPHAPRIQVLAGLDSPLLSGWWRPVLLLPASALTGLPPASLEAILAHELAHLARKDAWTALIQSLVDAFLHFHPAAWWLSRQVRELRELAADDRAVALTGDPAGLAEGLAILALLRRTSPTLPEPAPAAARGSLMFRIQRLLNPVPTATPAPWGMALLLVAGVGLTTAFAQQQPESSKPTPKPPVQASRTGSSGAKTFDFSQMKVLHRPAPPAYPAEAKMKGIQGMVVVQLTVGEDGIPMQAKSLSGPEALRKTAEDYALTWRFEPVKLNGKPSKAMFKLTMPFKLSDGGNTKTARPAPRRPVEGEVLESTFDRMVITLQPAPPPYPADAMAQRIQGTVVVEVTVDREGIPMDARGVEGPDALRPTAENYAMTWRFKPAIRDGKPVQARFRLVMPFKLK